MSKKTWKEFSGTFDERQHQESNELCACGCGRFISNRAAKAKAKAKGSTDGYIKGHTWKNREIPESAREKMRANHADVSGEKNPNYGKGLHGDSNPNWQGGKVTSQYHKKNQPGFGTTEDRAFRGWIRARDKSCVLCGRKNMIEVHHIESWVNNDTRRFDPANCVSLCKACHVRADNAHHKERIRPMLLAYIETLKK